MLANTALTSSGGVLAWGENDLGQLGDGSVADRHTPVPARLPTGTKVTGLFGACGDTVALTSAGRVLSWGDNQFGQLGNNSTRRSLRPVSPRLPASTRVTAVAAGCHQVLARTAAGRVLAWGSNIFREIGDGSRVRLRRLPTPVRLPAGVRVFAVAAGPAADSSLAVG